MLSEEVDQLFEERTALDEEDLLPIIGQGSYSTVYHTFQGGKLYALKRLLRKSKPPTTRDSLLTETRRLENIRNEVSI